MASFATELEIAVKAAQTAAFGCREVQSKIRPAALEKKDRSPVTIADFASQALICRALSEAFPDDPIIGEEDARELRSGSRVNFLDDVVACVRKHNDQASPDLVCDWIDRGSAHEYTRRFWTLDPIDGTKGFLRGGQYAISLALIVDGEIKVGVIACPNLQVADRQPGVILSAIRGQGAVMSGLDNLHPGQTIGVSETVSPADATFCESVESGHSAQGTSAELARSLNITKPPRRMDSQAKYAAVATGLADLYMRLPTRPDYQEKIWDHAGGAIIVEEAGGTVTDISGRRLEWTHGRELSQNKGVIVSNGRLHVDVIAALKEQLA